MKAWLKGGLTGLGAGAILYCLNILLLFFHLPSLMILQNLLILQNLFFYPLRLMTSFNQNNQIPWLLNIYSIIFIGAILWFLIGAVIGYLISKKESYAKWYGAWKTWPYWLRGAMIFLIFPLIGLYGISTCQDLDCILYAPFLGIGLFLEAGHPPYLYFNIGNFIFYFVLGAIIGWTWGKVKKRRANPLP